MTRVYHEFRNYGGDMRCRGCGWFERYTEAEARKRECSGVYCQDCGESFHDCVDGNDCKTCNNPESDYKLDALRDDA